MQAGSASLWRCHKQLISTNLSYSMRHSSKFFKLDSQYALRYSIQHSGKVEAVPIVHEEWLPTIDELLVEADTGIISHPRPNEANQTFEFSGLWATPIFHPLTVFSSTFLGLEPSISVKVIAVRTLQDAQKELEDIVLVLITFEHAVPEACCLTHLVITSTCWLKWEHAVW